MESWACSAWNRKAVGGVRILSDLTHVYKYPMGGGGAQQYSKQSQAVLSGAQTPHNKRTRGNRHRLKYIHFKMRKSSDVVSMVHHEQSLP